MMDESHVTVCRLCMSHGQGMLPILSGHANYAKLISVFQLKVLKRAGVPSHICSVCVERLDAAHRFKQQILDVEKTLQTLYGQVCITKAKSKLAGSFELDKGGENPIYLAEIDTKYYKTSSAASNYQEVAIGEEVDPIAIDHGKTAGWEKSFELENSRPANGDDTRFAYVSMNTQMDYISVVDHIEPISFEEILEANKQKELEDTKEARKINNSEVEVGKNCCCLICGKTFWNVKLFTSHMTRHGSTHNVIKGKTVSLIIEPEFKCVFCKEEFSDKWQLRKHPCPCNKPKKRNYGSVTCSRCGKVFSGVKDLNEHIANIHTHWCRFCGKGYNQESSLFNHLGKSHKKEINLKNSTISEEMENMEKLRTKGNEIIPIIPQLNVATAKSVSREVAESVVKIKVEHLAEAPYNQELLQTTDDLVFNDNHVFIKEEVDLGTETIGPNDDGFQIGCHESSQTTQTVTLNAEGHDTEMRQTVIPFKIEAFYETSLKEEEKEIGASHFHETESIEQPEIETKYCCCLICNTSFQYISQFVKHMKRHDGTELNTKPRPDRILCTVCQTDFLNTKHYRKHLNRGKCPKTPFSAQQAIEQARKAKGGGAKQNRIAARAKAPKNIWAGFALDSVKCTFCSKSFTRAIELERHRKQHRLANKSNHLSSESVAIKDL